MALYQSIITNNCMVYGAVPSNSITWSESPLANTSNTVIINALTIQDIQDQLLLLTSAEEFTTPFNREQLLKITKEKNIQAIMDNTVVDPVKGRVQVNCLYKPNLPNLGDYYYGATKRIYALHARIADEPEVAAEIDKYINQQINNMNYIEINPRRSQRSTSTPLCSLQLCGVFHQLLHQGQNDHRQFYAHRDWPQPQRCFSASSWKCSQHERDLNTLQMSPSLCSL